MLHIVLRQVVLLPSCRTVIHAIERGAEAEPRIETIHGVDVKAHHGMHARHQIAVAIKIIDAMLPCAIEHHIGV